MAFSEIELKRIEKLAKSFLDKRRPPVHIRKELDIGYCIDGNSIVVFEIRPLWNNPEKTIEEPVAKATYIKKKRCLENLLAKIRSKMARLRGRP